MRNGNLLKSRVSEICIKRICLNQGVGVTFNFNSRRHSFYKFLKTDHVQGLRSRRRFFCTDKSQNKQKISICKSEKFLTLDVKNVLPFWGVKLNQK